MPETGLRYDPKQCWVLCFFCLMMGLMIGFSELYFSDIPLYVPIITISLALLSSLIPIFLDVVNRFLSFDIRSERGYKVLRTVTAIAIGIQSIVFLYFALTT